MWGDAMNNCENCIHYDMCVDFWAFQKGRSVETVKNVMRQASNKNLDCNHFDDKDLYVKLPCKVGDVIYYVHKDVFPKGQEFIVTSFEISSDKENCYYACCGIKNKLVPLSFNEKNIGINIFLTKSDLDKSIGG